MQHRRRAALLAQAKENAMDVLERESDYGPYRPTRITVGRAVLKGTGYLVRLLIFAPLAALEPVINWILSMGCLLSLLCWVVFRIEDPTGVHHLHYGLLLGFSIGCAVLLALYYIFMRAIEP
jgi:hypothetical protein